MFSKELENLIEATLEDGVLEEYEKAALAKRAQAEDVDLAELEIYINSILQKRKRELAQAENAKQELIDQKKKEAFGRVCPNCGKQVPPLTLKCECGYEFTKENQESAVMLLADKLFKIQSRPLHGRSDSAEWEADRDQRDRDVLDAITMFPVPSSKDDIMDFLSLAAPNSKYKGGIFGTVPKRLLTMGSILIVLIIIIAIYDPTPKHDLSAVAAFCVAPAAIAGCFLIDKNTLRWNKNAAVWRAKFDQAMMKGRSLRADAEFTRMLDYYENQVYKK